MAKAFDKPIIIQVQNPVTEEWEYLFYLHAAVNKAAADNVYLGAGASQQRRSLVFEVRYYKDIEQVDLDRQRYRIIYQNVPYDLKDYDDYQMRHRTVKLLGVSC